MRLVTYSAPPINARLGIIKNENIIDALNFGKAVGLPLPATMLELIDMGEEIIPKISEALKQKVNKKDMLSFPIFEATLLAPIPKPRKNIFGIGLNYTKHVAESARALDTSNELPKQPVIFSKPPTAVIGTNQAIKHNKNITRQLDWEVELAVIIGKKGKNIKKEEALDYVFGYTVINDISARDCRRAGQWIVSKGQDTFAPMGPAIVTKDEIPDPHNLDLWLTVNGVEKQRSSTRFMLFNVNELIHDLSTVFTLEPGDIIATGTPAGVGAGREPQEWLWPGDVVEASVGRIGTIRNMVEEIG